MMSTSSICKSLVEFEERAATLYLALARRFTENKELSWFWLEMGMQERQHAMLLEFCGCEQLFSSNLPDRTTIEDLSNLFTGLEARAHKQDLSLDEAFIIGAELEASELDNIYARLVRPVQGTWYLVRKKIETLIPDHMQTLLNGARTFGVSGPALAKMMEMSANRTR
jgi:hypothetical protein